MSAQKQNKKHHGDGWEFQHCRNRRWCWSRSCTKHRSWNKVQVLTQGLAAGPGVGFYKPEIDPGVGSNVKLEAPHRVGPGVATTVSS